MCPPGTYFCGSPEACAQCRTDSDCSDTHLPTYDSRRSRCDVDSGVAGFQGFCQECLSSGDCAGSSCNLDPSLVNGGLDGIGFETCADFGPACPYGAAPGLGGCVSSQCTTDADCASALSNGTEKNTLITTAQQAKPFCVGGHCSNLRDAGYFCPNCLCEHDSFCRDPRAACDVATDHCGCSDSSQCGGAWPICEPSDGGGLGSCGCQADGDCGDAGLRCLDLPSSSLFYGGRACLFTCTDPRFPGCADLSPLDPICEPDSGLCRPCQGDGQCLADATGGFVGPYCLPDGACGCKVDGDCPSHEVCRGASPLQGVLGDCVAHPLACTPASCQGFTCDYDSGACLPATARGQEPCFDDFDCGLAPGAYALFCDQSSGGCVQCRDSADCIASGLASRSAYSWCLSGTCQGGCSADADCTGNSFGPHCVRNYRNDQFCGCGSDSDCGLERGGLHCVTDPLSVDYGYCGCQVASDCRAGLICPTGTSACQFCTRDADCATGFACNPFVGCSPTCDDGGTGCAPPFPACDVDDFLGHNSDGGGMWCYQCLTSADCPADESCVQGTCGAASQCYQDSDCPVSEVCNPHSQCQVPCDAGSCPLGSVCDTSGVTGVSGFCFRCLSPLDCPNGEGCNSVTHTCGSCPGPTINGGLEDCPPGTLCSAYWDSFGYGHTGACLQSCDAFACENPGDTCAVFPSLSTDHKYCFGCLQDSDCADAGAGWRCDTSVGVTFTCKPPGPF